jgi:hypothetical protein
MVVQLRAQADPCIGCIFPLVRGVLYGLHCYAGIAVEELNLGWYREVAGGINVRARERGYKAETRIATHVSRVSSTGGSPIVANQLSVMLP